MISAILGEQAMSEMMEALRLKLIQLPEKSADEDALAEIAKPSANQTLRKHTPSHGQPLGSVRLTVKPALHKQFCVRGLTQGGQLQNRLRCTVFRAS